MTDITRRQFLRGDFSRRKTPLRPPWALAEPAFIAACTRCRECVVACPERILAPDANGYPAVDFTRGECTFCAKCLEACAPKALLRTEGQAPWLLKAHIGDACVAKSNVVCRSCGDACPVQAIRFSPRLNAAALPEVALPTCTGCGACVAPCPADAVSLA